MAHFEEFLQYAEKQKAVDRRYNKKVVKKVTNLPDEDLDAFMLFCRPDKDFVINAPDYDLYEAIKKCADDFNGKKMRERKRLR
jgi:aspartate/methionine/tyrosine aminotransferase